MWSFYVNVHTIEEVQEFVALASVQPFDITVGNESQSVNGKSLMGYFCLDPFRPMQVRMVCTEEEYSRFYDAAEPFRVK